MRQPITQKECSVENCLKPLMARGVCNTHYRRLLRRGTLDTNKVFHGMSRTPEYKVWADMINRTENIKDPGYVNYGQRGIRVSAEWRNSFLEFYKDMGNRPLGATIDRIDNNLGYSKDNCRWASKTVQVINRRTSKNNSSGYKGITKTAMNKWQACIGINRKRYYLGTFSSIDDAISAREKGEVKYHKALLGGNEYAAN